MCVKEGDKRGWLQWACIFVMTKPNQTHAVYTHLCSTSDQHQGSQTTLFYRGREGEFNEEQQEVKRHRAGKSHRKPQNLLMFSYRELRFKVGHGFDQLREIDGGAQRIHGQKI